MQISDWVLRSSIETASRWHHGAWTQASVAINLSSRQLLDRRFVERVMDLLREHRLPAHCIEIELTPLTRVKLDRTLIASIHTSARSAAIARAIVGLCHSIGLDVTAEGIECPQQLALLTDLTPIHLQGYLLARPVTAEKLLSLMAALPNHMASLLLMSSTVTNATVDASAKESSTKYRRAL